MPSVGSGQKIHNKRSVAINFFSYFIKKSFRLLESKMALGFSPITIRPPGPFSQRRNKEGAGPHPRKIVKIGPCFGQKVLKNLALIFRDPCEALVPVILKNAGQRSQGAMVLRRESVHGTYGKRIQDPLMEETVTGTVLLLNMSGQVLNDRLSFPGESNQGLAPSFKTNLMLGQYSAFFQSIKIISFHRNNMSISKEKKYSPLYYFCLINILPFYMMEINI